MKDYQVFIDLSDENGDVVDVESVIARAINPEDARRNVENALCGIENDDKNLQREIQDIIDMIRGFEYDFYVWEVSKDDIVEMPVYFHSNRQRNKQW